MRAAWIIGLLLSTGCGNLRDDPRGAQLLHGPRFADPSNPDFHGSVLARTGYRLDRCATCHGADFSGGEVGVSCVTCHPGGPDACTTCHGNPPTSGAHGAHTRFGCAVCHQAPQRVDSPGHIDGDAGVEIVFSGLAALGTSPAFSEGRCSEVYCHGASLNGGASTAPRWEGGPTEASCGTCHAEILPNHFGEGCVHCHVGVVDADRRIVSASLHVNGQVDVRDLGAGCSACHGPPQDLGGAHSAHIAGARLGRAVACAECHVVPDRIGAAGHLDANPGAEITFGPLARTAGAQPSWDLVRCNGAYCHGATLAGGTHRSPAWNGGSAEVTCGSCHGVPFLGHFGERCNDCHSAVVDRGGRIVRPDLHINGQVDFEEAP